MRQGKKKDEQNLKTPRSDRGEQRKKLGDV